MSKTFDKCNGKTIDNQAEETFDVIVIEGSLCLPDGSVSAPSLKFTDDIDTGIYRIGANNLGITAGGANVFDTSATLITNDIPVVIDTTSAEALLVRANGDSGDFFTVDTTGSGQITSGTNLAITVPSTTALVINDSVDDVFVVDTSNTRIECPKGILRIDYAAGANTTGIQFQDSGSTYEQQIFVSVDDLNIRNSSSTGDIIINPNAGRVLVDTSNTSAFTVRDDGGTPYFTVSTVSSLSVTSAVPLLVTDSTASTSKTTGSVILTGGLGSAKEIWANQFVSNGPSSQFIIKESDNSNKQWNVEVNAGSFLVTESAVATQLTIAEGGAMTVPGQLNLGSNKSGTPGVSGSQLDSVSFIFTDNNTAGSGTATNHFVNTFNTPTLVATNASVTTTNACNVYIASDVTASTNETITNNYALWVDAGESRYDESIILTAGSAPATTTAKLYNVGGNIFFNGQRLNGSFDTSIGTQLLTDGTNAFTMSGQSDIQTTYSPINNTKITYSTLNLVWSSKGSASGAIFLVDSGTAPDVDTACNVGKYTGITITTGLQAYVDVDENIYFYDGVTQLTDTEFAASGTLQLSYIVMNNN